MGEGWAGCGGVGGAGNHWALTHKSKSRKISPPPGSCPKASFGVKIGGPPLKKIGGGPVLGRDYFWKVFEGLGRFWKVPEMFQIVL